jgi:hypothetical protein
MINNAVAAFGRCMAFMLCPFLLNAQQKDSAASSTQALADKLANPVASLISVPLQSNIDYGIGPYNGSRNTINVQPVIPIKLSSKINLITRYVIPIVDQRDITGENTHQFGLSDATISGFFAPSEKNKNGLMGGIGPAILVPVGTNDFLSTRKWGIGPSVLLLKQSPGLTYGFLVNQIWSFAGDKDRSDVSQMFLQPFLTHNWKSGAGIGLSAEVTSDWMAHTTLAVITPTVSAVSKLGKQTISMAIGPRIPVAGPSASKPDFGFRGVLTFVFPQ